MSSSAYPNVPPFGGVSSTSDRPSSAMSAEPFDSSGAGHMYSSPALDRGGEASSSSNGGGYIIGAYDGHQQQHVEPPTHFNFSYPLTHGAPSQPHTPSTQNTQWYGTAGAQQNTQHSPYEFQQPGSQQQITAAQDAVGQQHPMLFSTSSSSTDSSSQSLRRQPSSGLSMPLSAGLPASSSAELQLSSRPNSASSLSAKAPRVRVNMACVHCRSRKIRCDGQQPSCATCTRLGRSCHYENISELENVVVREKKRKSREAKQARMEALQQIGVSVPRPGGAAAALLDQRRRSFGTVQQGGGGFAAASSGMVSPSVLRESRSTPMNLHERQAPYPASPMHRQGLGPPPLPSPLLASGNQRMWQSQHPMSASAVGSMQQQQQQQHQHAQGQQTHLHGHSAMYQPFSTSPVSTFPPTEMEYNSQAAGNPRRRGATISGYEQRVDPVQGPIWRGPIAPGMTIDPGTGLYDVAVPHALAASQPATPDGTFPFRNANAGNILQHHDHTIGGPSTFASQPSGGGGAGAGQQNDPGSLPGGGDGTGFYPAQMQAQIRPTLPTSRSDSNLAGASTSVSARPQSHAGQGLAQRQQYGQPAAHALRAPALDGLYHSQMLNAPAGDVESDGLAALGGKESGSSGTPNTNTSGQPVTPQNGLYVSADTQSSALNTGLASVHAPNHFGTSVSLAAFESRWPVSSGNPGGGDDWSAQAERDTQFDPHYRPPLSLQFTPISDPFVPSSRHSGQSTSTSDSFYSSVAQLALQSPLSASAGGAGQPASSIHRLHTVQDYGFPVMTTTRTDSDPTDLIAGESRSTNTAPTVSAPPPKR